MRLIKTLPLATALAATLIGAGAASAASITNGSFESGSGDAGFGSFSTPGGGSTNITGWTVTGGSVDWINGYWQGADGTHSVDLNGLAVGGIEQTIATTLGQTYRLSFSMSGNPDIGSGTRTMQVSAGGASAPFSYTFTTPTNDHSNMNWANDSLVFTATGPSTLISFQSTSTGNCCWGPALDNVSISAVGVPEPSTWAMTILGLGVVGAAARRRRATAVAVA